jgi:hypothetical protein
MPGGDAGTLVTLHKMRTMARSSALDPLVRQTAVSQVAGIAGQDGPLLARVIRDFVSERTMFLNDPSVGEALFEPRWLCEQILTKGLVRCDCDDVALLTAALGLSIGLRARFVVVGFTSPKAPYRHVWAELSDPVREGWVPVDPTRSQQALSQLRISRVMVSEV